MPVFEYESTIDAPVEAVFGFHERADALERLSPRFPPMRVVSRTGGIEAGARVELELGFWPVRQRWVAVHTAYERNRLFVDEQEAGPFRAWRHRHEFIGEGARTRLRDRVEFQLRGGWVADFVAGWVVKLMLGRMFAFRHRTTAEAVVKSL